MIKSMVDIYCKWTILHTRELNSFAEINGVAFTIQISQGRVATDLRRSGRA